jgi:hypothetical protein
MPGGETLSTPATRARNDTIAWSGAVAAVQPRIRLTLFFDERSHTYLGYLLRLEGIVSGASGEFRVAVVFGDN